MLVLCHGYLLVGLATASYPFDHACRGSMDPHQASPSEAATVGAFVRTRVPRGPPATNAPHFASLTAAASFATHFSSSLKPFSR